MHDGIMDDGYGTYDPCGYGYTKRQLRKRNAAKGVHISNKSEGKVLRRLMSQTGMSEKEIRSIKKYNKLLTEAQLIPQLASPLSKVKKKIKKKTAEKLKLSPEHPKVVEKSTQEFRSHLLTKIDYHKDTDKRAAERHEAWRLLKIQEEKNKSLINKLRNFYY